MDRIVIAKLFRGWVFFILVCVGMFACASDDSGDRYRQVHKFNDDWKFQLADKKLSDNWRPLNLPHDWSIESSYDTIYGTDWQSGFLKAGTGWYQKEFTYEPSWDGKKVVIHFEGVYMNSTVWINEAELGTRPNGYLDFQYDLTPHLQKGVNTIKVKVDHSKPKSARWYTGSGIYRNVWLNIMNPTHIDMFGVHFQTNNVSDENSNIQTYVTVINESDEDKDLIIQCKLKDKEGKTVLTYDKKVSITKQAKKEFELESSLLAPALWSPDEPNLYTLSTEIIESGNIIDNQELQVGFRDLVFRGDSGFFLNNKSTLFKGVCMHHATGPLGAAVPKDVLARRLSTLKDMGCNAIRTAHNPFSPDFYQLCNEMGFLVMDEFTDGWEAEKAEHDYGLYWEDWWKADAETFLKRDRNHPSVVMWSIGNEVKKPTRKTQKELMDFFKTFDNSRPITQGGHDPTRGMKGEHKPTQLDVKGFNGDGEEKMVFEKYHADYPNSPMVGTEVPHTYQTRGVYRSKTHWRRRDFPAMWELKSGKAGSIDDIAHRLFDIPDLHNEEIFEDEKTTQYYKNGKYYPILNDSRWADVLYYQSSYDNATVRSGARKAWQRAESLPYMMGQFRWTAFDYLGETNLWPSRFANFGIIDIAGFPKDHYYLYQSLWSDEPMVHILPHWTHTGKEGVEIPVVVYTNAEEVELFLNGKSLGNKAYEGEQLVWLVPFEAGEIKAVAKTNDTIVAEKSHITAGEASKIALTADRKSVQPNESDVIHVEVDIQDEKGVFQPYADNVISFNVSGPAKIIGVENGDPLDLSDYKTNVRKTFRGKCLLILQSTDEIGDITIEAISEGLKTASVRVASSG